MIPFFTFIIAAVCIAIFVTIFCQPVLREEDRLAKDDPQVDIHTLSKPLIILCWLEILFVGFILFTVRDEPKIEIILGLASLIGMSFAAFLAYRRRSNYYRMDNKTFTFVRNGEVEWSYRWEDIECINRRIVSTGKSTTAFLDLICKDGTVHKNLPNAMSKKIRKHMPITRYPTNYKVIAIVVIAIILSIVFGIFLSSL